MTFAYIVMAIGYFLLIKSRWKRLNFSQMLWLSLLYFYVWLILFLTIVPKDFSINPNWKNSIPIKPPYDNLKPYFDLSLNRSGSLTDVILNILMMIPFGFLYSKVKRAGVIDVVFTTFLLSSFIEVTQLLSTRFLVYHRFFDVTDIINNTIGGLIGLIICKLMTKRNKEN